jgi:hypothetical protein
MLHHMQFIPFRIRSAAAVVLAALTLGAGLTACGQDDTQNSAASTSDAGFPMTIDHLFGSTTIKAGHVAYWGGVPVINTPTPSGEFSSAFSIGGPLGIKYVIPPLVPQLKEAVAGKG